MEAQDEREALIVLTGGLFVTESAAVIGRYPAQVGRERTRETSDLIRGTATWLTPGAKRKRTGDLLRQRFLEVAIFDDVLLDLRRSWCRALR